MINDEKIYVSLNTSFKLAKIYNFNLTLFLCVSTEISKLTIPVPITIPCLLFYFLLPPSFFTALRSA